MAFEGLSQKLSGALSKLTGRGKLTEQSVKEGMREVRVALLEADVNYLVVKDFIKKVREMIWSWVVFWGNFRKILLSSIQDIVFYI